MRLEYTRSERRRKAVAQSIIDDPTAIPTAKAQALKTLDHLEANAQRRANPEAAAKATAKAEKPEADPDGWQPTLAQQAYLDRLAEEDNPEEAEVWRLVYKMEAA